MDELDARLRAMAKREHLTLPTAYETAMDSLEEQVRQGTLPRTGKRRLGRRVLVLAAGLSCLIAWTPLSRVISSGFSIVLCTLAAAGAGAWLFPREEADHAG